MRVQFFVSLLLKTRIFICHSAFYYCYFYCKYFFVFVFVFLLYLLIYCFFACNAVWLVALRARWPADCLRCCRTVSATAASVRQFVCKCTRTLYWQRSLLLTLDRWRTIKACCSLHSIADYIHLLYCVSIGVSVCLASGDRRQSMIAILRDIFGYEFIVEANVFRAFNKNFEVSAIVKKG